MFPCCKLLIANDVHTNEEALVSQGANVLWVKVYNRTFKRKEESRNVALRKDTLTLVPSR
jgi:hypothetical protein